MKVKNKSLLYVLLFVILLFQSCAPQIVHTPTSGDDECQPPPPDVFVAAGVDLKFAQTIFKRIVLGGIDIKTNPKVFTLASRAVIDERIREYIRCLAIKKEGFTHAQAAYLERLYAFMRTNPTPEQFIEWQKIDPFPDVLKIHEAKIVQEKLYSDAKKDRSAKHQEEMTILKNIHNNLIEIINDRKEEDRTKNLIKYDIDALEEKDNLYYRAITITNVNESITQHNFTLTIEGDANFDNLVNGPRPIGGGPIEYIPPKIENNICNVVITEIKPKKSILIGLYSQQKWNLVNIKGYRN